MKITLCGSMKFLDKMETVKRELELMSHKVDIPVDEIKDDKGEPVNCDDFAKMISKAKIGSEWVWEKKKELMRDHFNMIKKSNAILVCNFNKGSERNYIGGSVLIEMAIAFDSGKKIFILNKLPKCSYREEILAMRPVILNKDLEQIK